MKTRSLQSALGLAVLLVLVDAFLMNQGVISLLVGVGLLLVGLPRAFLRKFSGVRSRRLANLAVYVAAVVMVVALNWSNNRLAAGRADGMVSAIKAFHSKYQRYPESLGALVPEFIERVPRAKYTLGYGEFAYYKSERGPTLSYTSRPPFGRPTYDFNRDAWNYLD